MICSVFDKYLDNLKKIIIKFLQYLKFQYLGFFGIYFMTKWKYGKRIFQRLFEYSALCRLWGSTTISQKIIARINSSKWTIFQNESSPKPKRQLSAAIFSPKTKFFYRIEFYVACVESSFPGIALASNCLLRNGRATKNTIVCILIYIFLYSPSNFCI